MPGRHASTTCSGRIWFTRDDCHFLGPNRVLLLERIGELGSISRAAKALKMSYKAAWDSVEAMNRLSPEPLVVRVSGGHGGGGTRVTEHGRRMILVYRTAEETFHRFLDELNTQVAKELGAAGVSARPVLAPANRFDGMVLGSGAGGLRVALDGLGEVTAGPGGGTGRPARPRAGTRVQAIIHAAAVHLLREDEHDTVLAGNLVAGGVDQLREVPAGALVQVRLDGGGLLTAFQPGPTPRRQRIAPGDRVLVAFRADDVLLALPRQRS